MPSVNDIKDSKDAVYRCRECMRAVRDNWERLDEMLYWIKMGSIDHIMENWSYIDYADQEALMLAPTKGGFFTTAERKLITENWTVTHEDMGI